MIFNYGQAPNEGGSDELKYSYDEYCGRAM
jgi:hypothetical protein